MKDGKWDRCKCAAERAQPEYAINRRGQRGLPTRVRCIPPITSRAHGAADGVGHGAGHGAADQRGHQPGPFPSELGSPRSIPFRLLHPSPAPPSSPPFPSPRRRHLRRERRRECSLRLGHARLHLFMVAAIHR